MLQVDDIHTYYGESYALQGVSLEVAEGQIVAIMGRNGMGKTTLIRSIAGFTPPRRGRIRLRDDELVGKKPFEISRLGVGLVPQGRRIFPSLTVQENLTVAARGREKSNGWSLDRVNRLFPILRERSRNQGTALSGGEQQMLAIGRALMTNPELLLMDEPSEGLAPMIVHEIGDLVLTLKNEGLSVLLVEQNITMATRVADVVYVLSNGRVVFHGDVEEFRADTTVQQQYIGVEVTSGRDELSRIPPVSPGQPAKEQP